MPRKTEPADARARALLEAHVRFEVEWLTAADPAATAGGVVDAVLDALAGHQVADVVDAGAVGTALADLLVRAPGSPLVSGIVELVAEVAYSGPEEPGQVSAVVARAHVEALLDRLLTLTPLYERALEGLTASPLVGTVAARFMGRVVGEVVATNQEIANKVPGLGSLVSFGTSAAWRVKGAADKPFEALLGSGVAKGGSAFAVRRLNRILIDTLRDPVTREAALQAWDLVAEEPLGGLDAHVTWDEATGVVDAVHDLAIGVLAREEVTGLVVALVEAFVERFGGYTPPELLEQLDVDRDVLTEHLVRLAPGVVDALHGSGDLERLVRARLAPFYASSAARAALEG